MKKLASIILLIIIGLKLMAQQDPKFSQNMYLLPVYNPGAIGQSDKICVAAAFRNQWTGLPNAPVTTTFTAHSPVKFLGRTHGVGINLMNDNLGYHNDFYASLSYSYKVDLGAGKLGAGIQIGLANQSLTPEWFTPADESAWQGDIAIPQGEVSDFAFDVGLGLYYSTDNLYAGFSTTHLNQASFDYADDNAEPSMVRHYYAVAGYNIQLSNPMFELIPSFMLQTDLRSNHIYLNTNIRYNKKFWGGVSYTIGGAATALFGIELLNGIKVGYSYDFELSPLLKYNSGSHEITVRYCFDLSLDKSPQKYESIRFL